MGLMSFMKDAGEKLFGIGHAKAAEAAVKAAPTPENIAAMSAAAGQAIADYIGTQLFLRLQKLSLTQQQRCVDPVHAAVTANLRLGDTTGLRQYIHDHLLRDSDASEFAEAPIISPGNPERRAFSRPLLSEWAAATLVVEACA